MAKALADEGYAEKVTVRQAVKKVAWARNCQLTVSGYSPLEIATGRRPPDLLDVETCSPEQLSVDPSSEDRTTLELQRIALRAHQEARQAIDLRKDLARRVMPSDGPYRKGDRVFVWHKDESKKKSEGVWVRGVVVSQEGAMVLVEVHRAVLRVNQSKVRRDHDPWHDVAIPLKSGDDSRRSSSEEVLDHIGDKILQDAGKDVVFSTCYEHEICYHTLTSGKSDFVEISPHLTGLTACVCHSGNTASAPILFGDWTSKTLQSSIADAWKVILTGQPDHIVIHPVIPADWPKKAARAFWHFCAEVCRWQDDGEWFVTVIHPARTGFFSSQCSRSLKWRPNLSLVTFRNQGEHLHGELSFLTNLSEGSFDRLESLTEGYDSKDLFDPRFAVLLSHCVSRHRHSDSRQGFLFEDIFEDFEDGALCSLCLRSERNAEVLSVLPSSEEYSLLSNNSKGKLPRSLHFVAPQRFVTSSLVQTLSYIDKLLPGTELEVHTTTSSDAVALRPMMKNVRVLTLPYLEFEYCNVYRGTFGKTLPVIHRHPDAVVILWNPGDHDHVFFVTISQLLPCLQDMKADHWSMIVFWNEANGSAARRGPDVGLDFTDQPAPAPELPQPPANDENGDYPGYEDPHADMPVDDEDMPPQSQQPEPDLNDDPIELGSGCNPPPAPAGGGTFVPVPDGDDDDLDTPFDPDNNDGDDPPGGGPLGPGPGFGPSPDEPPVPMEYHDEAPPPGGPPGAPGAVPQFSNPDQVLSPPMPWPAPATPIVPAPIPPHPQFPLPQSLRPPSPEMSLLLAREARIRTMFQRRRRERLNLSVHRLFCCLVSLPGRRIRRVTSLLQKTRLPALLGLRSQVCL